MLHHGWEVWGWECWGSLDVGSDEAQTTKLQGKPGLGWEWYILVGQSRKAAEFSRRVFTSMLWRGDTAEWLCG